MTNKFVAGTAPTIEQIAERMIAQSGGNGKDISHFMGVWAYARTIGMLEGLDRETQYILEIAALTHDIACPLCREKYGSTAGPLQEREGALLVRELLGESGLSEGQLERISWLIGQHHTFSDIQGLDYQILVEADYIQNALEKGWGEHNTRTFRDRVFRTRSGIRLLNAIFLPQNAGI